MYCSATGSVWYRTSQAVIGYYYSSTTGGTTGAGGGSSTTRSLGPLAQPGIPVVPVTTQAACQ